MCFVFNHNYFVCNNNNNNTGIGFNLFARIYVALENSCKIRLASSRSVNR